MSDSTPPPGSQDDHDAAPPVPGHPGDDDLLAELRLQNRLLGELLEKHRRARPVANVVLGVLLAFTALWSVAQTDWGAENVAVPVKFFVSGDQADAIRDLGDDSGSGSGLDIYGADGDCIGSDDPTADDFDPDC